MKFVSWLGFQTPSKPYLSPTELLNQQEEFNPAQTTAGDCLVIKRNGAATPTNVFVDAFFSVNKIC